jgi:quercetin dioxygenase-like cupin family protein
MSEKLQERNETPGFNVPVARSETLIDDGDTRVTQWTLEPGEGTGWHRHELPYLVIPHTTGHLTLYREDGSETVADYTPGAATKWSDVPFVHHAVNTSDETVRLLEVEYK